MAVVVRRSKRYKKAAEKAVHTAMGVDAGVDLVKSFPATKFDQSVELIFSLGIDPKHADQMIRGSMSLPHGIGKTKRVVAFCPDHLVAQATAAGVQDANDLSSYGINLNLAPVVDVTKTLLGGDKAGIRDDAAEFAFVGAIADACGVDDVFFDQNAADVVGAELQADLANFYARSKPAGLNVIDIVEI